MATCPPSSGIIGSMFRMPNTMLMAMSRISTEARPACSDWAPRLAMPRMETGRGAEPGLLTADCAALLLVTWWKTDERPLGENVCPSPETSWLVTFHMVDRAWPGAARALTDAV